MVSPAASQVARSPLLDERPQLAVPALDVNSQRTNVFLADDIPDGCQPGYGGLKEDLP